MIFKREINYAHDKQAIEAFKTIMNTRNSILLTGKVRTGKTTLIKSYLELSYKKSIVLAPNKLEAIKSNEVSVQTFFKISETILDDKFQFLKDIEYTSEHENFIKSLELIVIDDVILLSSAILDCINIILQNVRGNLEAFGGIQLILIGDLFEPIVFLKKCEREAILKHWKSEYFFDAKCYNYLDVKSFNLSLTYIDKINYDLEMLYYSLGKNTIDESDLDFFNSFANYNGAKEDNLILTIDSKSAHSINYEMLKSIDSDEHIIECDFHGSVDTTTLPVEPIIYLKKGAKVLLLNNEKMNDNYENGAIGIFTGIYDGSICVTLDNGSTILVERTEWVNYDYCYNIKSKEYSKCAKGVYKQYPIRLGWAISIEDSKGMMFKKLHFENKILANLENGQAYGIYRRSHTGHGLSFTIPFKREDIKSDSRIMAFHNKNLRSQEIEI